MNILNSAKERQKYDGKTAPKYNLLSTFARVQWETDSKWHAEAILFCGILNVWEIHK